MGGVITGIILFAAGAIMRFALYTQSSHANLRTIGVILMIVGIVAFLVGIAFEAPRRYQRSDRYVRNADGTSERVVSDRTTI